MTKEELIALSDLNREDNIKYISSEAQGIAITLDSDRYAPNLCKLERAYICGRRKSEEQIKEIENYFVESAGYGRDKIRNFMDIVNKALEQKGERITELEKENAELKKTYRKQRNKRIDELQKENAELKDDNKVMADNYSKMEQKFYDNLTKAKEIIKELMSFSVQLCDCRHTVDFEKTREEAEQFISEVEK